MELHITGTNMPVAPAVRSYVERKLGKLSRHLPSIIETRVEISEERTKSPQHHYLVRATVTGGGTVFHCDERGKDLLAAVDKVAAAMIRQLEHYKGKLYDKGRGASSAKAQLQGREATEETERRVVKVKRFAVKTMSLDEAIDQMDLLGHDFFLFLDADTKEPKLLYRRKDSHYGLIEPDIGEA